jgi:hypothetical protein
MTQGLSYAAIAGTLALIIGLITSMRIKSPLADHALKK